jgi:hypothetical protein
MPTHIVRRDCGGGNRIRYSQAQLAKAAIKRVSAIIENDMIVGVRRFRRFYDHEARIAENVNDEGVITLPKIDTFDTKKEYEAWYKYVMARAKKCGPRQYKLTVFIPRKTDE